MKIEYAMLYSTLAFICSIGCLILTIRTSTWYQKKHPTPDNIHRLLFSRNFLNCIGIMFLVIGLITLCVIVSQEPSPAQSLPVVLQPRSIPLIPPCQYYTHLPILLQ